MYKLLLLATAVLAFAPAHAFDVNITPDTAYVVVQHNGKSIRIQRIQDQSHHLSGGFAKTSRKCPPFCIQPMVVAPGVTTIGELELIDFIKKKVNTGKGLLIDARTPAWHARGTIPGSINVPFTVFALGRNDEKLIKAMATLGVTRKKDSSGSYFSDLKNALGVGEKTNPYWDFSNAKELVLWCNGMWCGQSPRAIHGLLKLGYPAEKINYYRDGMQGWKILGLTVITP